MLTSRFCHLLTNATAVYLLLLLLLRVIVLLLSEFAGEIFSTDSEFEVAVADFLLIIIGTLRDRPQGRPKESMFLR